MNILVTGATGFIGKNLTSKLINEHHVYALVRKSSNISVLGDEVELIEIVDNIDMMTSKIRDKDIDGVIHLASKFLKSHDSKDIDDLVKSNIQFGAELLEIAVNSHIKWFLNTGTFWQHYKNEEYNPVNLYASTKQAFEDIAKFYFETTDLTFVTLKLSDTFGPNDTRPKIINLLSKISNTGETLKMSPGEQIIDVNYIDNVVEAYIYLVNLLEKKPEKVNGKCYSLKSKERLNLKSLVKLYEETTSEKINVDWGSIPYRKREVMIPWEKGNSIPGFEPKVSLKEGIRKFYNENKKQNY